MSGRQSTIDRPEPVSRVKPPSTTIANTIAHSRSNHLATARSPDVVIPKEVCEDMETNLT